MNEQLKQKELSTLTPKRNNTTKIIFVVTILLFLSVGLYLHFRKPPIVKNEFFDKISQHTSITFITKQDIEKDIEERNKHQEIERGRY